MPTGSLVSQAMIECYSEYQFGRGRCHLYSCRYVCSRSESVPSQATDVDLRHGDFNQHQHQANEYSVHHRRIHTYTHTLNQTNSNNYKTARPQKVTTSLPNMLMM